MLYHSRCNNITDNGLMQVVTTCRLQHLLTKACQGITDTGVCCLAQHLLSLVRLDLSGCMNVTNKSLETLQESLMHRKDETQLLEGH